MIIRHIAYTPKLTDRITTDIWTFLPYNGSARYRTQGDRGGDALALNPGKHSSQPATETLTLGPFCTDPVDRGAVWRL